MYERMMEIQIVYYLGLAVFFSFVLSKIFGTRNQPNVEIQEKELPEEKIVDENLQVLNPEDQVVAAEIAKKNQLLHSLSTDEVEEIVQLPVPEELSPSPTKRRVSFILDQNEDIESDLKP